jgi:hypothetical protein
MCTRIYVLYARSEGIMRLPEYMHCEYVYMYLMAQVISNYVLYARMYGSGNHVMSSEHSGIIRVCTYMHTSMCKYTCGQLSNPFIH